ncbi:hypothetical protein ACFO5X_07360 [Seohaeicola nanhaiensis]|uniref:Uncharacterized protein n=1 Tax=Seohaeicola nanhaiensis TaxID=1387282 RepID=A0ABV9KDS5_9RHOB
MTDAQITMVVVTSLAVAASAFGIRQAMSDAEDARDYGFTAPARRWHAPVWIVTAGLMIALPLVFWLERAS